MALQPDSGHAPLPPAAEGASPAPPVSEVDPASTARVPLMVTGAMRERLRELGYVDSAIDRMTPAEAHERLSSGGGPTMPTEAAPITTPPGAVADVGVPQPALTVETAETPRTRPDVATVRVPPPPVTDTISAPPRATPPPRAAGPPAETRRASGPQPTTRQPRDGRHSKALVVGAIVAVLALGGAAGFYLLGGMAWITRSEAVPAAAKEAVRRGVSLAGERQYDRAIVEFSQAISVAPKYSVAYANRGVAYIQKREFVKALDDLRKAAELNPRDPLVHYNLAALYSLQNERTFALEALQRALEHGFNDFEALGRDPDFDKIRQEARFRELIARYRR